MAIPGQANINIGAENQVAGSDTLFDAFHTIQNNFTTLFETSSPFDTFRAGEGVTVSSNVSNGVVSITNIGVTKITAGTGISVSGANGNVTISTIPVGPAGVTRVGLTSTSLNVTGGNIVSQGNFTVDLPRLPTGEHFATGEYIAPTLTVDGFGRITSIANGVGVGTVTSVGLNPGKGISVTGGPIVDSGSISVENTGVTSIRVGRGLDISNPDGTGDITIAVKDTFSTGITSLNITSNNLTVTGSPVISDGTITVDLPESFVTNLYSNAVAANYIPTYTGNLTPNNISANSNITANGNITANNITATNVLQANVVSANTFTGTFSGNATTAGTVTTNAQPNITSVGTLSSVTTSGNANVGGNLNLTGNADISGNINSYIATSTYGVVQSGFDIGNDGYIKFRAINGSGNYVAFVPPTSVPVAGLSWQLPNTIGTASQVLVSDGGPMYWRTPPAAGSNSQIQFNDAGNANGSTNLTFNKTTGTMGAGNITVTGNTTSVNVFASTQMTAPRFISNIATGTAPFTVTSTTQVANLNAALAGTVVTAAQPNITSTGTLTGLTVSGNATFSGALVTLGAVANLRISGGTSGQVLRTDGAGNVSWVTASGFDGANVVTISNTATSTSTSTGALKVSGGVGITGNLYTGGNLVGAGTLYSEGSITSNSSVNAKDVFSSGRVEASGNIMSGSFVDGQYVKAGTALYVYGQSQLGSVGNVQITGGSSGQVLSTDGAGNLSWISVSGGGGSFDGANVVNISNTATSLYPANGALVVSGGVGIGGNINAGGNITAAGIITSEIGVTDSTGTVTYTKWQGKFTNTEGEWMQSGLYYDGVNIIINEKYWKDPVAFAQVKFSISTGVQFGVDPAGPSAGYIITAPGDWVEQTMYGVGIWTINVGGVGGLPSGALGVITISNATLVTGATTAAKLITGQVIKTALNGQLITNRITSHDADVTFSTYDIMFNAYRKVYIGGYGQAAIMLDEKVSMSSTGVIQNSTGDLTFYPGIQGGGEGVVMTRGMVSSKFVGTWATTYGDLSAPNAPVAGQRAFITDSDKVAAGNFGTLAGGGGSNGVPVYFDGTDWRIG